MSPLVQAALVADNFAGIQCGLSPALWLSLGTIETSTTKVLRFLGGGIIGTLNGETGMRRKIGHEVRGAPMTVGDKGMAAKVQ
jgi:hypothetical protein